MMNAPLIDFALRGLDQCWLPEFGRWSHIYHLDGRKQPNESKPESDVFYTLNVLLGMARVPEIPAHIDPQLIFHRNIAQLMKLPVRDYALGTALWTGAELDTEIPNRVIDHIDRRLSNRNNWWGFHAQDLGMILIGVVAQAKNDPRKWGTLADELFLFLVNYYEAPSGLFYDMPGGLRRRFASFATQTYLILACYAYGELKRQTVSANAIAMANKATRRLIVLQGNNGEWPWFFDAKTGRVLDFYEIYTVHQCGMAPAFLSRAEVHGVIEAKWALMAGFKWALHDQMFLSDKSLTIRSHVRKGELHSKRRRIVRAIGNSLLGRSSGPKAHIECRMECRSYELGWILWSFGNRTDLTELTHHKTFNRVS